MHRSKSLKNHFSVFHVLTRTYIADRARLSPLFNVFRRIRVLPEEPFLS